MSWMGPVTSPPAFSTVKVRDTGPPPSSTEPNSWVAGETKRFPPLRAKVAVTVLRSVIATWQALVPLQPPPDQPAKSLSASGSAVSVTVVDENSAEQVPEQLRPSGLDVTVPSPVPELTTVSSATPVPSRPA